MSKDATHVDRRMFLAALPAIAAADELKLAVDGGKPVRSTRLSTGFPGAQFYDEQERMELNQAYDTHTLFRFYGPQTPEKVVKFEQELGSFMGVKHALAVTSGTAALHTALTALGVG